MFIKKLLIFLLIIISFSVNCGEIHAFLIGDTFDSKCGTGFAKSIEDMKGEVTRVADQLNRPLNLHLITGDDFRTECLIQEVGSLKIKSDDVVILYCACHGYRTSSKKNRWPSLMFKCEKKGIDFGMLQYVIRKNHPYFFLAIADCCNSVVPEVGYPLVTIKPPKAIDLSSVDQEVLRGSYQKLYLEDSKCIIASAAKPGESCWTNRKWGNFFTQTFLRVLHEIVSDGDHVEWEFILDRACQEVSWGKPSSMHQNPQYSIYF